MTPDDAVNGIQIQSNGDVFTGAGGVEIVSGASTLTDVYTVVVSSCRGKIFTCRMSPSSMVAPWPKITSKTFVPGIQRQIGLAPARDIEVGESTLLQSISSLILPAT